jgi:hypothetical protein
VQKSKKNFFEFILNPLKKKTQKWVILSCGHLFCVGCLDVLSKSVEYNTVINGKQHVQCALCREMCSKEESQFVSTRKQETESEYEARQPAHFIASHAYDYSLAKNELSHIKIRVSLVGI